MSNARSRMRRVARAPVAPLVRYLNTRFRDLHIHLDHAADGVIQQAVEQAALSRHAIDERVAALASAVHDGFADVSELLRALHDRVDLLASEVTADLGAEAEFAVTSRRAIEALDRRLQDLAARLDEAASQPRPDRSAPA